MVAKYIAASLVCASVALAGPVPPKRQFGGEFGGFGGFDGYEGFGFGQSNHVSFDGYGGFHSLDNFDNFYGPENFCGFSTSSLVAVQTESVVCQSVDVEFIQQQLAVVREWVKKIITTQICETETQTVVFSQFQTGLYGFGEDLRHVSGRHIGFDSHIASHIGSIHDSQGEIVSNDLGFTGADIGTNFVSPIGFNWDSTTSPATVGAAFSAAQSAASAGGAPGSLGPEVSPPSNATDSAPDASSTDGSNPDATTPAAPPADDTSSAAPATSSSDSSSSAPNAADD